MRATILGLAALMTASASQAAVQINFSSGPPGNVGSNTHTYTGSGGTYSVTATGYSNYNFSTNTGTANNLYDKSAGGDEVGVGLLGDPTGDHEIWYTGNNFQTIPTIILNVSSLFSLVSSAQFSMGSTTGGEQWILRGWNGTSWVQLISNGTSDGSLMNLPGWGTYSQYAFISGGTVSGGNRTSGNVLLGALSLTPLPEPSTWAMMLIGFGALGFAARRQRKAIPQIG